MTTISLTLMPRAKFSTLSLYEKNAYLQALAADFCAQTGRPYRELDKDVLARLRRYYSRRVWADLKLTRPTPISTGRSGAWARRSKRQGCGTT